LVGGVGTDATTSQTAGVAATETPAASSVRTTDATVPTIAAPVAETSAAPAARQRCTTPGRSDVAPSTAMPDASIWTRQGGGGGPEGAGRAGAALPLSLPLVALVPLPLPPRPKPQPRPCRSNHTRSAPPPSRATAPIEEPSSSSLDMRELRVRA